jgi:tRNA A58 N-methylase Trm61
MNHDKYIYCSSLKVVTFSRVVKVEELLKNAKPILLTEEMNKRMSTASVFVNKMFVSGVTGGTHPLCTKDIRKIAANLGINPGDIFWEIGCGVPNLAFSLSAASFGGMVICTDIRKCYFFFI